jgi:hypothetical protein
MAWEISLPTDSSPLAEMVATLINQVLLTTVQIIYFIK